MLCSTRAQWSAPFAVEYLSCTARVTSSRGAAAGGSPHEPGAGVGAPGRRGRGAARRSRVLPVTRPSHATTLRSPFRLTHVQLFTLHTSARRSAYRRAHRTGTGPETGGALGSVRWSWRLSLCLSTPPTLLTSGSARRGQTDETLSSLP